MISADGHEKLITHVFVQGDRYLDSDAVFGVKNSLIREYTQEPPGTAPDANCATTSDLRASDDGDSGSTNWPVPNTGHSYLLCASRRLR